MPLILVPFSLSYLIQRVDKKILCCSKKEKRKKKRDLCSGAGPGGILWYNE